MFKDYYNVLGIASSASGEQVRSAFKRLALQYHPDKTLSSSYSATNYPVVGASDGGGGTRDPASGVAVVPVDTTQQFTEIQEAYEVLSDIARRYLYDMNYQEMVAHQRRALEEAERRRIEWERQQQAEREAAREREKARILQQQQQEQQQQQAAEMLAATLNHSVPAAFHMQPRRGDEEVRQHRSHHHPTTTVSAGTAPVPKPPRRQLPPLAPRDGRDEEHAPWGGHEGTSGPTSSSSSMAAGAPAREVATSPSPPSASLSGGKPRKEHRNQHGRPSPSARERLSASSTRTSLPTVGLASTMSLSLDPSEGATGRRGYPLPCPESEGRPQDYHYRKSIEKTLRVFFADALLADGSEVTGTFFSSDPRCQ